MNRPAFPRSLAAVLLLVLLTPLALADGDGDVYVDVDHDLTSQVAEDLAVGETGEDLYDAQEGAHDAVTDGTGEEVDHYYVWICFGGQCVPVDPIRYSN